MTKENKWKKFPVGNSSDEEIMRRAKELHDNTPCLVHFAQWKYCGKEGRVYHFYQVFKKFELEDNPVLMGLKMMGMSGYLPIDIPEDDDTDD